MATTVYTDHEAPERAQRADARRNRERVLAAARRVMARKGTDVYGRLANAQEAGHLSGSAELQLELTRIVMTEQPRTFMDDLRFAAMRSLIVTGMRAGEVALLPVDWKRERTYLDSKGRPEWRSAALR